MNMMKFLFDSVEFEREIEEQTELGVHNMILHLQGFELMTETVMEELANDPTIYDIFYENINSAHSDMRDAVKEFRRKIEKAEENAQKIIPKAIAAHGPASASSMMEKMHSDIKRKQEELDSLVDDLSDNAVVKSIQQSFDYIKNKYWS